MTDEVKQEKEQDVDVIKAIREEYEKKLEEQRKELEQEKEDALKKAEAKHVEQIRALMTGKGNSSSDEDEGSRYEEPLTKEEQMLQDLEARFKL